jgi:hypothetical protein
VFPSAITIYEASLASINGDGEGPINEWSVGWSEESKESEEDQPRVDMEDKIDAITWAQIDLPAIYCLPLWKGRVGNGRMED